MRISHRMLALGAALPLVLASAGCASTGRVDALEKRVDDLSSRLEAVSQKADAAERNAAAAAQRADEAARTSEAIFKKRISK
jgi:outer membrane murein-binding lipoprotein Lpp